MILSSSQCHRDEKTKTFALVVLQSFEQILRKFGILLEPLDVMNLIFINFVKLVIKDENLVQVILSKQNKVKQHKKKAKQYKTNQSNNLSLAWVQVLIMNQFLLTLMS